MKKLFRRSVGVLTSLAFVLSLSGTALANTGVYDPSGAAGAGFSLGDDQVSVRTLIYPGDRIAGTTLYVGYEHYESGEAASAFDVLDDGATPCWTNTGSTVYSVTDVSTTQTVPQLDEAGEQLYAEDGTPIVSEIPVYAYLLQEAKYVLEVAGGTASTDDPSQKDTEYALRGDLTYAYTDANGAAASLAASQLDAAAYPFGTTVYLTADAPADPTLTLQGWTAYRVEEDGVNLSPLSADQLPSLGIAGAEALSAAAIAESGGRLLVRADSPIAHVVFVPVYAQVQQEQAPEEIPQEEPTLAAENAGNAQEGIPEASAEGTIGEVPVEEIPAEEIPDAIPAVSEDGTAEAAVDENGVLQIGDPAPEHVYTVTIHSVDPQLQAEAEATATYAGGDFYQTLTTAEQLEDGQVFTGWSASPEGVISFDDPKAASTGYWFEHPEAPGEDQAVEIRANYAAPAPAVYALTLENAESDPEDASQVEAGTQIEVNAEDRTAEGLAFSGWTADGIELDDDQITSAHLQIVMPEKDVSLTAQYQAIQIETPQEQPAEDPAPAQVQEPEIQEPEIQEPEVQGPEAQEQEVQEPEVQEPEVQEPEVKEPEAQDADAQKAEASDDALQEQDDPKAEEPADPATPESPANEEGQEDDNQNQTANSITNGNPSLITIDKDNAEANEPISVSVAPQNHASIQWKVTAADNTEVAVAKNTDWATTFTMPDAAVTVNATVTPDPTYTLTVNSGSGAGSYYSGDAVSISANAAAEGYRFAGWSLTSGSGTIANTAASATTFTIGSANAAVTANYELIPYTLTVKSGSGSGTYTKGTSVDVTPTFPESGKEFDSWETVSGSVTFEDAYEYYTSVTMKASDATIKATYKDGPSVDNNKITGLENGAEYLKSTTLSFTAAGAGMDNTDPNPGDYRYRPTGYQIGGVSGSWNASPYTTSMAINAVGDYTLTVTYARDVYDGSSWNADGTTTTRSITFHVVNALSVQTGDTSPLIPLAIAGCAALAVIIALLVVLRKRKKNG